MTRRGSRPCRTCRRSTRSITRYCRRCRPATAIPTIHRLDHGISFAGVNLTDAQAIHLANQIIDTLEDQ